MARYADIDVLLEHLTTSDEGNFRTAITQWLEMHQVEDVAPVIHAHWEIIYESSAGVTDARCSNCGYESLAYENDVHTDENCNYCPCCGAKMDEEVNK